jgi:hypothetical protein
VRCFVQGVRITWSPPGEATNTYLDLPMLAFIMTVARLEIASECHAGPEHESTTQ